MKYAVEYEEHAPKTVLSTPDECLSLAHEIHDLASSSRPLGVYFCHPNGDSLLAVFGTDVSWLNYIPANYAETAVGSLSSQKNTNLAEPLDFWCCGHHGQVPRENAVQISTAFSALEEFLWNGNLPTCTDWVPD